MKYTHEGIEYKYVNSKDGKTLYRAHICKGKKSEKSETKIIIVDKKSGKVKQIKPEDLCSSWAEK